jgi:hypothetical protein
MTGSVHALARIKNMLSSGPLPKNVIADRLGEQLNRPPTSMELVGMLRPYNGIEKLPNGTYALKNA